ncbi:rfaE bifunctional protein [Chloroherpeton thalassium ATCC 35110]|uniref:RfaE bifunctional protein n=1 Tax=Chloroherpeton thalassium (strain ATCC 35110 / GB-78) TaxID=517418 RepID=B3QTC4_CHLT3|nr:D-glycero-beta-D-manno-heptose-7-phosphate kinase [Chloroherpeton thalassium]ACF14223.1 rfaE bifunctional protein [Chloroherpeton thalassium ATCC 35110]
MERTKLTALFNSFREKSIAVIGDVMLDKYIIGEVTRVSPEAPVPVIDVHEESYRLGGAANVAMNIHSLGGSCLLFGVTGNDDIRTQLAYEMTLQEFSPDFLAIDPTRKTTCKTRVIAQNHHIVRIDTETKEPISDAIEQEILNGFTENISIISAVIFEDYNKGVLTKSLIHKITKLANQHDIPILVDPKRANFFEFQKCTVFKPNLKEISDAFGRTFKNTDKDVEEACRMLREKLKSKYILLTRGEKGVSIYNDTLTHIPSVALEVADVSGAGDTVIAVLTLGLSAGLTIVEAAKLANFAAGIVCGEVGAVAINKEKLFEYCLKHF